MAWTFEFQGEKFDTGTLTLDDYIELEVKVGVRWGLINPALSAKAAVCVAAYMYAQRTSTDYDDACAKAKSMNADDFADALNWQATPDENDDEAPPKDPPKAGES